MSKGEKPGTLEMKLKPDEGQIRCIVRASGYKSSSFMLDPGDPPSQIILEPGDLVHGCVYSPSGEPVPGAFVDIIGTRPSIPGSASPIGSPQGVVETNSDGTFSMPLIGSAYLRAHGDQAWIRGSAANFQ